MKFSVYQASRKGGREINEDRLGYSYTRESALLVLADGMGGHPEGEKAAELATQAFSAEFLSQAKPALDNVPAFLERGLKAAQRSILEYAAAHLMSDNPRTTLVAAVLQDNRLTWVHSGDSRLYWIRDGELLQRTRDHSYHEKAGALKHGTEQVNRNILFTCLGSPVDPLYDVSSAGQLMQGDRVLLCSDGLWSVLEDGEIAQGIFQGHLQPAVTDMVETALRRGGRNGDNVSVLALEWETPTPFEPTHVVETDSVIEGGFASTIQSSALDALVEDLDDAAIERSIAEINEAIRRTAARKG
jgi:serine/threonine protein phosphatase PrpC